MTMSEIIHTNDSQWILKEIAKSFTPEFEGDDTPSALSIKKFFTEDEIKKISFWICLGSHLYYYRQ